LPVLIFTFHFAFQLLFSVYFTGAVVLSVMANVYTVMAVVCFSLAVALSTFAQGLFILTNVLSVLPYAFFD
jgi:hypothetical protein